MEDRREMWPKTSHGRYICSNLLPMPQEGRLWGTWEHDGGEETESNSDYYIRYKCSDCGHEWKEELPE